MAYLVFGFDKHIINVYLYVDPDLICEHPVNQPLVSGSSVLQPKRHHIVTIQALVSYKARVLLVGRMHRDLIVPRVGIHEGHCLVPSCHVHQLVDTRVEAYRLP